MLMKKLFNRAKEFYEKYELYFMPAAFVVGFTWDNLTFKRIDLWFENIILASYLALILAGIIFVNFQEARRPKFQPGETGAILVPYLMQFAFGGIFSGFFVFYSRSAAISSSWPFLLFLLGILIGNEFFRSRYSRFTFQISVFFIALFSYAIFIIPVLIGKMGADIFLISGLASIAALSLILLFIKALMPIHYKQSWASLLLVIPTIFITFNLLYFTNIIPPIPLSLKEIGIYHAVTKTGPSTYRLEYEPQKKLWFFEPASYVFSRYDNRAVYVFGSVFAPTKLNTEIYHRWEYFDGTKNKWISMQRPSYGISGGRDGGYRGWTRRQNPTPGKWRVSVETARGQIIGRIKFTVIDADAPPKTLTRIK